jgi:hypothetical protein
MQLRPANTWSETMKSLTSLGFEDADAAHGTGAFSNLEGDFGVQFEISRPHKNLLNLLGISPAE